MNPTKEELTEWQRIEKAATPPPWSWRQSHGFPEPMDEGYFRGWRLGRGPERVMLADRGAIADAAFIAVARTAVPRLLSEVERLQAENERLNAELLTDRQWFQAQNAALLEQRDHAYNLAREVGQERDRLREALEQLAYEGHWIRQWHDGIEGHVAWWGPGPQGEEPYEFAQRALNPPEALQDKSNSDPS